MKQFKTFSCVNPGTGQSSCSSSVTNNLAQQCSTSCVQGTCMSETLFEHDVALVNLSSTKEKIVLQTMDGTDLIDNRLQCNEKYKVKIKVKNVGNFSENVTFDGSLGSVVVRHLSIDNFDAGASSEKTRTVNISLPAGIYTLQVQAQIPVDVHPADNIASKEVQVLCSGSEPSSLQPFCVDHDGGLNYDVKSNVTFSSTITTTNGSIRNSSGDSKVELSASSVYDYCFNATDVVEYICQGTREWPLIYHCPYGCEQGRCTSSPLVRHVTACGVLDSPHTYYILDNDVVSNSGNCFRITADDITFDGQGYHVYGSEAPMSAGVYSTNTTNLVVKNFTFSHFSYGVFVTSSMHTLVKENAFHDNFAGVIYSSVHEGEISDNYLYNQYAHISLASSSSLRVRSNTGINASYGIAVYNSTQNLITENVIAQTELVGIYLQKGAQHNTIQSNYVSNSSYGITLTQASANTLMNNTIFSTGFGVTLHNATDNIIKDTVIKFSKENIGFFLGSTRNIVENVSS